MANTSAQVLTNSFSEILAYANGTASVNFYMAHGGTNFGWTAGELGWVHGGVGGGGGQGGGWVLLEWGRGEAGGGLGGGIGWQQQASWDGGMMWIPLGSTG